MWQVESSPRCLLQQTQLRAFPGQEDAQGTWSQVPSPLHFRAELWTWARLADDTHGKSTTSISPEPAEQGCSC